MEEIYSSSNELVTRYEIKKQEQKDKCINYMIQNPSILLFYRNILNNITRELQYIIDNNIKINKEVEFFLKKDIFKELFFDFLIGTTKYEDRDEYEWIDIYKDEILEEFAIYKSKILSNNHDKIGEVGGEIYKEGIILYRSMIINLADTCEFDDLLNGDQDVDLDIDEWYRINDYFRHIYKYSRLMRLLMNFYETTVKEFEKNEDLIKIYKILKSSISEREYIEEKIYSFYENLYKDVNHKIFTRDDIEKIIKLKDKDELLHEDTKTINCISSKQQIIDFLINDLSQLNEQEMVIWIAKALKDKNNIDVHLKNDIIQNIDNIIDEAIAKIKRVNAQRERDRLLKMNL